LNRSVTVEELLAAKRDSLDLEFMNPECPLGARIMDPDVANPGLALAGYIQRLPVGRIQVFGETEMSYLATLDPETARERLRTLFGHDLPVIFVTKGQTIPGFLMEEASAQGIPVLRSSRTTKIVFRKLKPFLEAALAPLSTLHGSLADVYGVGLLFVGKSGVGKSECVLDLVERGHRLVADDLVLVSRRGNDVLIGRGHERSLHHMEIRGIGIIDVRALFGIRAIRQQKRIEVVVQLEHWEEGAEYDRTGLANDETEILGVTVPKVTVPLNPGKNITVISEVVAMNHLLKYSGVDSAAEFHERLEASMRPVREYLEEDYE
jgi:HPr kinase/phosphorylase